MKFIISIDTEGDNQWDHGREVSTGNIRFVPRFQEFCESFNIKPTYVITSEVCDNPFAREIFREYSKGGKAEIGAHLHSWTTPPYFDRTGLRYNDRDHAYASELPEELLFSKIKFLTDQIEELTGERPYSFRSGRYGFNDRVARALIKNSYIVDSSVTPFISWAGNKGISDKNGGPDFSDKLPFPYTIYLDDSGILEIPVTILPTKFPLNKSFGIAQYYFKNADKLFFLKGMRRLFFSDQPAWLRPFEWTTGRMFGNLLDEAIKLKLPYLVMMFHSSELMPGCSIYRKNEDSIEGLYDLLGEFFRLLNSKEILSVTLTQAAREYNKNVQKQV